jgi:cell cycle sensor histidine kinase DivJ
VFWHLAWAGVTAAAAGLMLQAGLAAWPSDLAVLGVGVAPAVLGALLALSREPGSRPMAILLWGVAGTAACLLTGGATGPLAAWCLAPLAAAAAFRRAPLLPLGVAVSIAAGAISALSSALALTSPPPAADLALWESLLAVCTVVVGLGAGLVALTGETQRDGRERDQDEAALRELLAHQPQLVLAVQLDGRIAEAYGSAVGGLEAEALAERQVGDLAAPEDRGEVEAALRRAAELGAAEVGFAPAQDPGGWVVLNLSRVSFLRFIATLRDARVQKSREDGLEQARISAEAQNAGKSRFLANMSHELRTPLNAIMGFSDIMRQRLFGPLSDRYAEYAELVHESGAHLLELINDVLDMSKIEAERFELAREAFDAREAASAVLRLMRGQAERAGVQLRGALPPEPLEIDADRRAVKQIALNLLSNALKFTPRGGSVTLTLQGAGDVLEIIVSDTGVGIAPADLERLGRPFEQAGDADQRAAGAGLGLSLVRAFARLHGGEMTMESAVGEGTTVTVRLPVLFQDLPAAAKA